MAVACGEIIYKFNVIIKLAFVWSDQMFIIGMVIFIHKNYISALKIHNKMLHIH